MILRINVIGKTADGEYECEYCGETFCWLDGCAEHEEECRQKDPVQRLLDAGRYSDAQALISGECHACKYSVFAGRKCWRKNGLPTPCVSATEETT